MNTQEYEKLKREIPDFKKKHCFWVATNDIIYDKNNSQIRAKGHIKEKFPQFGKLIQEGVELPPASVARRPNGKVELKEGATRAGGAEEVGEKLLVSDYHDQVLNYGPPEWEDFQAINNDHELHTNNSIEDIEVFIDKQIYNGNLSKKLGMKFDGNPKNFVEKAAKHYKKNIFSNAGKDLDFFRRKVEKALKPVVAAAGKYQNYSKTQAISKYKALSGVNWGGNSQGVIDNSTTMYPFCETKHTNPNIMGYAATKHMNNQNLNIDLVWWSGNLTTKQDTEIFAERATVEKWFDRAKAKYSWFRNLYALPQILQGSNAEDMDKLITLR